jgi:hypothetical protein
MSEEKRELTMEEHKHQYTMMAAELGQFAAKEKVLEAELSNVKTKVVNLVNQLNAYEQFLAGEQKKAEAGSETEAKTDTDLKVVKD